MEVNRLVCMYCGACVGTCPNNAIFLHETRIEFGDECNSCGLCYRVCPVGAIEKTDKGEKQGKGGKRIAKKARL